MNTECTCVSKVERELAQLSFAMDDLRLFLDTHPCDKAALAAHGEMGASMRYLSQRYTMPWRGVAGLLTDIGTEELAHLEMVSAIVYQLTKGLSADEIRRQGFDTYFVDHTAGVWPQAAGGTPFTSMCFASKGDAITDLHEDMAADGATGKEQQCCLSGSVRFSCALARAAKI